MVTSGTKGFRRGEELLVRDDCNARNPGELEVAIEIKKGVKVTFLGPAKDGNHEFAQVELKASEGSEGTPIEIKYSYLEHPSH